MYLRRKRKIKRRIDQCLNCGHQFYPLDNFCSSCGQVRTDGRVTVRDLLKDAIQDIFNLDSRIIKSFRDLFIPGKLTEQFFRGLHQSYYPPARLFFVIMVLHFAILGFVIDRHIDEGFEDLAGSEQAAFEKGLLADLDSFQLHMESSKQFEDLPIVMDSLKQFLDYSSDSITLALLSGFDFSVGKTINISKEDMAEKSDSALVRIYQLEGINVYFVPQLIRIVKQPKYALRFLISNLIWMVLAIVPLLALIMKLLYLRRDRYYVEHTVFLFHLHAFAFILASLFFLTVDWIPQITGPVSVLLIAIYFYVALKRRYKQGWFKTFVKFSILLMSYGILFNLMLLVTMIISLFFFN